MQKYIGTKELKAQPMSLGEYNQYRGWDLPANEDAHAPGYLVEYLDGGKANDTRHEGYISWSPQEVFEKHYRLAESFKDRVIIEALDLEEKIEKLKKFIDTPSFFRELTERNQELLKEQHKAMEMYFNILQTRLEEM